MHPEFIHYSFILLFLRSGFCFLAILRWFRNARRALHFARRRPQAQHVMNVMAEGGINVRGSARAYERPQSHADFLPPKRKPALGVEIEGGLRLHARSEQQLVRS